MLRTSRPRRPRAAFTVLELLISLLVVGLLAALALTKFQDAKKKVYVDAMLNDLHNYALASEVYFDQHNGYADTAAMRQAGFRHSADVEPDSLDVSQPGYWYFRVRHRKTDVRCWMSMGHTDVATSQRPRCDDPDGRGTGLPAFAVALFTATPPAVAPGAPIALDGTLSFVVGGSIAAYRWTIPGGTVTDPTAAQTSVQFGAPGRYPATLTILTDQGDSASSVQTLIVQTDGPWPQAPTAEFTATGPLTPGTPVALDCAPSTDPDGAIARCDWIAPAATPPTAAGAPDAPATVQFAAPGVYPVTLTVTDGDGLVAHVTHTVTIARAGTTSNRAPTAALAAQGVVIGAALAAAAAPTVPVAFKLTAAPTVARQATGLPNGPPLFDRRRPITLDASRSADPDHDPLSYAWDLPDWQSATGAVVEQQFAATGRLTVGVIVTDPDGAADTAYTDLALGVPVAGRPVARMVVNPAPTRPAATITFDGRPTISERPIVRYAWRFDDGQTADGAAIQRTFPSAGTYEAILTVTDDLDVADSTTRRFVVSDQACGAPGSGPTVTIAPSAPTAGSPIIRLTAAPATGTAAAYEWTTDPEVAVSPAGLGGASADAYVPFDVTGTLTVTVTATDAAGCVGTSTQAIDLDQLRGAPNATFTAAPATPDVGQAVAFAGVIQLGVDDPAGYVWSFSDGATATGRTVTHAFASAGQATITLAVTNAQGVRASTTQTLQVGGGNATFTFGPVTNGVLAAWEESWFDATAAGAGPDATYEWDFGDWTTATVTAPRTTHVFEAYDQHTVTLTIHDGAQTATAARPVDVDLRPTLAPDSDVGYAFWNTRMGVEESAAAGSAAPPPAGVGRDVFLGACAAYYDDRIDWNPRRGDLWWTFDFGDGFVTSPEDALGSGWGDCSRNHAYAAPGTYHARIIARFVQFDADWNPVRLGDLADTVDVTVVVGPVPTEATPTISFLGPVGTVKGIDVSPRMTPDGDFMKFQCSHNGASTSWYVAALDNGQWIRYQEGMMQAVYEPFGGTEPGTHPYLAVPYPSDYGYDGVTKLRITCTATGMWDDGWQTYEMDTPIR